MLARLVSHVCSVGERQEEGHGKTRKGAKDKLTLEVGKAGLNIGDVLGAKLQDKVVLGLEVGASPGALGVDLGGPSRGKGGAAVWVEGLELLDPVREDLERGDPRDLGPDWLHRDNEGASHGGSVVFSSWIRECRVLWKWWWEMRVRMLCCL